MKDKHKSCRRTALARTEKLCHILSQLQDMKNDNCPAMEFINTQFMKTLAKDLNDLRWSVKYELDRPSS